MKHRVWLLRLWRLSVLIAAMALIRSQCRSIDRPVPLVKEQAKQWFPGAAKISAPDGETGAQYVTDGFGDLTGVLMQTLPRANDIIGYSGPSNTLIALDRNRKVKGAKLLSSGDTADHVRRVLEDAEYWDQVRTLPDAGLIRNVSGATLTSSAITRGILRALGSAERASLLFPYPLELRELQPLFPTATKLEHDPAALGGVVVLNARDAVLGRVLRTSPASDPVTGYKGPTDTIVVLDPTGKVIREIRVRDSYETEEYLSVATKDSRFLPGFSGRSVESMRNFDLQREGVSGVSGATRTSLAVVEGVQRRLNESSIGNASRFRFELRDGLLIAIVCLAGVLTFSSWRGNRWVRWIWNGILIGYVGLIAGDLVSQALLAGWATHGIAWRSLPGLAVLTLAALLVPLFTGKQIYCHHLCPHGAAQQWLGRLTNKKFVLPATLNQWMTKIPFLLLSALLLAVTAGARINLAAFEPFDAWIFRASGMASVTIALVGLIASVFHPLAYCKFGCPTGALLRFLRTGASQHRFESRDWAALGLLAAGAAIALWG